MLINVIKKKEVDITFFDSSILLLRSIKNLKHPCSICKYTIGRSNVIIVENNSKVPYSSVLK